jgi:glycosyltransferase involved in cell wall biosynthesis
MKIAFLLTQSLESPMGIGRIGPLARELNRLGHGVTILAMHPDFGALEQTSFVQEGVNVEYVAPMHVKKAGNLKTYYSPGKTLWVAAKATLRMTRSALHLDADIVHICKPHLMNGFAGLVTHILRGGKLFLDCDDYEAASGHFKANWQKKGVELLEKYLPRLVDCVTTNTYFLRELLIQWGVPREKIMYLSNGVEQARFKQPSSAELETVRAEWGLNGKRVITFVGSLSMPSHPVDLLLKAFQSVHVSNPETVLMLVGGGDQFDVLQNMAQELGISSVVRFCGRIAPEKVGIYYQVADVSVDPILADDIARGREPLKLFESWACGVPFVSADVGDRRILLGDPPAGLLARPGDPISLAEMILRVLNDQILAQSLRQHGLELVKTYFWEKLAQKMDSIYREKYHGMVKGA